MDCLGLWVQACDQAHRNGPRTVGKSQDLEIPLFSQPGSWRWAFFWCLQAVIIHKGDQVDDESAEDQSDLDLDIDTDKDISVIWKERKRERERASENHDI